jgi:hypothetical protein
MRMAAKIRRLADKSKLAAAAAVTSLGNPFAAYLRPTPLTAFATGLGARICPVTERD